MHKYYSYCAHQKLNNNILFPAAAILDSDTLCIRETVLIYLRKPLHDSTRFQEKNVQFMVFISFIVIRKQIYENAEIIERAVLQKLWLDMNNVPKCLPSYIPQDMTILSLKLGPNHKMKLCFQRKD